MQPQEIHHGRTTLFVFLLLLAIFLVWNVVMVQPYLLAIVMGGILALLCRPFYDRVRRTGLGPKRSSALVTIGLILLVIVPLSLFVVVAVKQGIALGQTISDSHVLSFENITRELQQWRITRNFVQDTATLERQARGLIQSGARIASGAILALAGAFPNLVLQLALASIACYFLLKDGRRFVSWIADKIPLEADVRQKLVSSFRDTAVSSVWATLASAATQAALMLLSFLVLGIPEAVLAAAATFIFAWIPLVGSTPVWIAGAIYLFIQGATAKGILMLIFGAIIGVSDNFVRPLVLKGRGEMHPLVALVAVFGGISMFGILGVFVGPILVAVLVALLQIWPTVGRRFGLISPEERGITLPGDRKAS